MQDTLRTDDYRKVSEALCMLGFKSDTTLFCYLSMIMETIIRNIQKEKASINYNLKLIYEVVAEMNAVNVLKLRLTISKGLKEYFENDTNKEIIKTYFGNSIRGNKIEEEQLYCTLLKIIFPENDENARISGSLKDLGIPVHWEGYKYIQTAVAKELENPEEFEGRRKTKKMCEIISKEFSTDSEKVEQAIQLVIDKIFECEETKAIYQKFFGKSTPVSIMEFIRGIQKDVLEKIELGQKKELEEQEEKKRKQIEEQEEKKQKQIDKYIKEQEVLIYKIINTHLQKLNVPLDTDVNYVKRAIGVMAKNAIVVAKGRQSVIYGMKEIYSEVAKIYKVSEEFAQKHIRAGVNKLLASKNINEYFGNSINGTVTTEQFILTVHEEMFPKTEITLKISRILKNFGMKAHWNGYVVAKLCIICMSQKPEIYLYNEKEVYKTISEYFNVKPAEVNKSISYAIEKVCENEEIKNLFVEYFGKETPISASEFITEISKEILEEKK